MPAVANENTPEGAASFIAHYIGILEFASSTGDVVELSRLSSEECGGCSKYISLYEKTYAEGGWFKDRAWRKSGSELEFNPQEGSESFVTTTVTISAGTYAATSSAEPVVGEKTVRKISFGLRFQSGWQVTQLGLGEPQ